jgi:hypothetical protein
MLVKRIPAGDRALHHVERRHQSDDATAVTDEKGRPPTR